MYLQVRAGRRLGTGQTLILNKLTDALHCTGDNQDSLAPCLVYMRTKVRSVISVLNSVSLLVNLSSLCLRGWAG